MWSPKYFARRYFPRRFFGPPLGGVNTAVGDTTQASQTSHGRVGRRGGLAGYVYKLPLVIEEKVVLLVKASGRSENPGQRVSAAATVAALAAAQTAQPSSTVAGVASVRSPANAPREQAAQLSGGAATNRENEDWLLLVA